MKFTNFSLVAVSAGQNESMCGKSSVVELQCGDKRHTPSLFFDQCKHRYSVRYLPDSILACMTAIDILLGEHPAVRQIGWILVRDIKDGLK